MEENSRSTRISAVSAAVVFVLGKKYGDRLAFVGVGGLDTSADATGRVAYRADSGNSGDLVGVIDYRSR